MITIGPYKIGYGRTFIIAEAGVNHNGDVNIAKKMIDAAKYSGADAIKFQSFQAINMCDKELLEEKEIEALTKGSKSSYDMYKALELDLKAHKEIFAYAEKQGILCFSSVFHPDEVDMLVNLNTKAIKISSGDITYTSLIKKALNTRLPVIISTGMATLSETIQCYEHALQISDQFMLLHCISQYPANIEDSNLRVIPSMKALFSCPIGFSDHSQGTLMAETASALGADLIEKHFTLDNMMDGPDHKLSLNPDDFKRMIKNIRDIEKSLGSSFKRPTLKEWEGRFNGRRGIKLGTDLKSGDQIKESDLIIIKPSNGLSPKHLETILEKKVNRDIKKGEPLNWCDIMSNP